MRTSAVPPAPTFFQRGFTLTELSVVLVIVALLIGGMMIPLSAQQDIRYTVETQKALSSAQDALLGFAAANGRLPCPASETSNGLESFCANPDPGQTCVETTAVQSLGRCKYPADGYLPAATLALAPVDPITKLLLDGWGNPIRYAVVFVADPASSGSATRYIFTGATGMKSRTFSSLAGDPNQRICPDSTCASSLTTQAVLVVWSTGKNAKSTGGTGSDEMENPNPNSGTNPDPNANRFVSHTPAPAGAIGGEFDDQVTWLSPHTLYNRMIAAGQLP